MCGFDSPKAPKIPTPPPVEPTPVFKAGSELDTSLELDTKKGKSSLKNESVGLGIPVAG